LLEVTSEGGFINPSARIGQLPLVVVDTEGRIYTPDSAATGDLLVPAVVVRDVGPTGAEQILTAMNAAGLDSEGSDGGIVADTGVTVFTAEIDGQEIINRIAAGGPPGPGNPGGADSAALDLLARLTDPSETWGAADVTSLPFDPQVYRVFSAPADAAAGAPVDWPLDQPLADFGAPRTPDFGVTGLRSGIVLGNDAVTLGDALADLPADTMIESDGQSFQVWVEPILPPVAG